MIGSVAEIGKTPGELHFRSCPIAQQRPFEVVHLVPPAAIALANQTRPHCPQSGIRLSISLIRGPAPSMPSGVHKSGQRSPDPLVPTQTARRRAVLQAG